MSDSPTPLDRQQLIVDGVGTPVTVDPIVKPRREYIWVYDYTGAQVHVIA